MAEGAEGVGHEEDPGTPTTVAVGAEVVVTSWRETSKLELISATCKYTGIIWDYSRNGVYLAFRAVCASAGLGCRETLVWSGEIHELLARCASTGALGMDD